jgi:hypothetical protein
MTDMSDWHELFADATASGCALQLCHVHSSCGVNVNFPLLMEMVDDLNDRGIDVTCEAYPYTAGMTRIDSGVFAPGWEKRLGIVPKDVEWTATGERLTEENFLAKQKEGGTVVVHSIPEEVSKYIQAIAGLVCTYRL